MRCRPSSGSAQIFLMRKNHQIDGKIASPFDIFSRQAFAS
jgi:hypothetical protein